MNLQVGVKLLIKNEAGQYLFLRRSTSFKPGKQKWDIPGGRINIEETLDAALAREVYEETSLALLPSASLLAAQDIFDNTKELHVVRLTYAGKASGEITLSDEHDSYKWVDAGDVLALEDLDTYLREVLSAQVQLDGSA